jgi:pimeloyl-ACP methyl ester carboxylesterase
MGYVVASAAAANSLRGNIPVSKMHWKACDKQQFLCTHIAVPIEYAHPSLGTIELSVIMLPAIRTLHPRGDIFLNPGGPGVSGVQFLEEVAPSFPSSLLANYNIVSWDPRGVGESTPAVRCMDAAQTRAFVQLSPDPITPTQLKSVVAGTKQFVADCEKNTPARILANIGTKATVEDLNTLRIDFGQSKLNYLGFSYGTYLGELYAQRYPTHIRAMVLDGVVNPALKLSAFDKSQALGLEGDLNAFFAWCNSNSACHKELPSGAKTENDELFARFDAGGYETVNFKPKFGGTQRVNLGVAELGVIGALYSKSYWPTLGEAISDALRGNGEYLAFLAYFVYDNESETTGQFPNAQDAEAAIDCLDSPSPHNLSFYEQLAKKLSKVAPAFGGSEAWSSFTCAHWPYPAQGKPAPIHAPGTPTILVVGSTGDPVTPYAWAKAVAKQLDNAELLTRSGSGHTGYFFSSCIRSYVDNYLTSLKLPPKNTICPSS